MLKLNKNLKRLVCTASLELNERFDLGEQSVNSGTVSSADLSTAHTKSLLTHNVTIYFYRLKIYGVPINRKESFTRKF